MLLKIDSVKASADEEDNYSLYLASEDGYIEIVRMLLEIEAVKNNAHCEYNRALRVAAENGHTEIVEMLLKIDSVKASADEEGNYALYLASEIDGAPRSAEDFAGHDQDIAEPQGQTGEDGNDREHNIRQDPSM